MCKYCDCKTKYKGYEKEGLTIAKSVGVLTSRTEDLAKAFKQAMEE